MDVVTIESMCTMPARSMPLSADEAVTVSSPGFFLSSNAWRVCAATDSTSTPALVKPDTAASVET